MKRKQIAEWILRQRVIAVVRVNDRSVVLPVAEALLAGGIFCIEITMTVPDALSMIRELAGALPSSAIIGAGSVLDAETAHRCVEAGARFVVSPVFKSEIVRAGHEADVPVIPGAYTPTEILTAHEAGADMVKVFPADGLGLPFFRSVLAPMPHLRLIPTGGVTPENAVAWLRAGACAVGIGSALLDPAAVKQKQFGLLAERAGALMAAVHAYAVSSGS